MRQRTLKDCGICSVAMFTGNSYTKVSADAKTLYFVLFGGLPFDGFRNQMEQILLYKYGVVTSAYNIDHVYNMKERKWKSKRRNFKKIVGNKKALITLPSLNFEACQHLVYFDGHKLHDPSNLKRYTLGNLWDECLSVIVEV